MPDYDRDDPHADGTTENPGDIEMWHHGWAGEAQRPGAGSVAPSNEEALIAALTLEVHKSGWEVEWLRQHKKDGTICYHVHFTRR